MTTATEHESVDGCPFCLDNGLLRGQILSRNLYGFVVATGDPVLRASVMVIPIRHVKTPFDLTPNEWTATHAMLRQAKSHVDAMRPDGYSIGWNVHEIGGQEVPHAHLHVIGRFADEPRAGRGIRYTLKQRSNIRRSLA